MRHIRCRCRRDPRSFAGNRASVQPFSAPPNASVSSVCCSISCALCEPVAGLALAERLIERTRMSARQSSESRQQERAARPYSPALPAPTQTPARSCGDPFPRRAPLPETDTAAPENNCRGSVPAPLALRDQFMPDFSAAEQHALRRPVAAVRNHPSEIAAVPKSAICEEAAGFRSMLFGVNTTSGLRHARNACLRSR